MTEPRRVVKVDRPFRDDDEIASLTEQFEQCRLPYERWSHRAHLAVATTYLRRLGLEAATDLVRQNIQRYNRTCGQPDGYHETITRFYMHVIRRFLAERGAGLTVAEVVEELVRDVAGKESARAYYSAELLGSAEARAAWVEPDLRPLDS